MLQRASAAISGEALLARDKTLEAIEDCRKARWYLVLDWEAVMLLIVHRHSFRDLGLHACMLSISLSKMSASSAKSMTCSSSDYSSPPKYVSAGTKRLSFCEPSSSTIL